VSTLIRTAAGTLAAAIVAAAAKRGGALSTSGAVAAALIGGAVVGGQGIRGGAALVAFFASSSLLGRVPHSREVAEQHRGNERDAVQVLANGGVAALLALAAGKNCQNPALHAAYGGAVATAAADTWATEIGSRWGGTPRSITSFRPVAPGASGGVTPAGLAAGAAFIAAVLGLRPTRNPESLGVAIAVGGVAGTLADSLLGATIQEVRWCEVCRQETEALVHRCGALTRPLRGRPWCNNDTVNALATTVGALTAFGLAAMSPTPLDSRAPSTR
jgi:uncharacterized protein (TIGR00297 family)